MLRKSTSTKQKNIPKKGYGLHNVVRKKNYPKNLKDKKLFKKNWESVSSLDLYHMIQAGWKTDDILKVYNIKIATFLNKLRYS